MNALTATQRNLEGEYKMPDNFWMGIWLVTWVISIYLCIVAYLRTRDLERRMKKIQREYDYSRIIGEDTT
jgi:hypothetical protein